MNKVSFWGVAASAMLLAGSADAANLISNGSFEVTAISPATFSQLATGDTTGLTGWTVSGTSCAANCVSVVTNAYSEYGGSLAFSAQDGVQGLDLTGGGNTLNGGLFQSVSTTPGVEYLLSFYVGNQDDSFPGYPGAESVELLIDDATQGTFTNSGLTSANVNWLLSTWTFTAASATTKIEFRNAASSGTNYAGLDNVSLEATGAVPEPGTLALGGAALLALVMARKRKVF